MLTTSNREKGKHRCSFQFLVLASFCSLKSETKYDEKRQSEIFLKRLMDWIRIYFQLNSCSCDSWDVYLRWIWSSIFHHISKRIFDMKWTTRYIFYHIFIFHSHAHFVTSSNTMKTKTTDEIRNRSFMISLSHIFITKLFIFDRIILFFTFLPTLWRVQLESEIWYNKYFGFAPPQIIIS